MESSAPTAPVPVESARALCHGCGGPLVGRQKVACSAKCRAAMSRHRRDAELREALLTLQATVGDLLTLAARRARAPKRAP